jgi:hypothetical protein
MDLTDLSVTLWFLDHSSDDVIFLHSTFYNGFFSSLIAGYGVDSSSLEESCNIVLGALHGSQSKSWSFSPFNDFISIKCPVLNFSFCLKC